MQQISATIHMDNSVAYLAFPGADGDPASPATQLSAALIEALRYDLSYQASDEPTPQWDGWYRLLSPAGHFPAGLVPRVQRLLAKYGVPSTLNDLRKRPDDELPLHSASMRFKPRDYQIAFAERALLAGRGVIDACPRSGKTSCGILIYDRNPLPTIWIAPTKGIVKQTLAAIHRLLPAVRALQLTGEGTMFQKTLARGKASEADIVVTTTATALKLPPAFWRSRKILIADEFHHAASPSWQEINMLAAPIYYRFGMTGTHFRSDPASEVMMHSIISDVIGKITAEELVARKLIAPAHVYMIPIEVPRVHSFDLDEQYRFGIQHHEVRNQWIVWAAQQCVAAGRKTIVLVKLKQHGEKLHEMISGSTYVNGDDSAAVERGIQDFNAGKIPCIIGTSVLGEGIDLPAADALIYARGGKASVTVTQDIYRVLTAVEGKREGIVIDFADRHATHLLRHSLARGRLYAANPTFSVTVVDREAVEAFPRLVSR